MVRCTASGLDQLGSKTWVDTTSLDIPLSQDPDNVNGCYNEDLLYPLNSYVTVPPPEVNRPSIVRFCPG